MTRHAIVLTAFTSFALPCVLGCGDSSVNCDELFLGTLPEGKVVVVTDSLCKCIGYKLRHWYAAPNHSFDVDLFRFLSRAAVLKPLRESACLAAVLDSTLRDAQVDNRVKCAMLLYYRRDVSHVRDFVSDDCLASLAVLLARNGAAGLDVDSLTRVVNRCSLDGVFFFLDNVTYLADRRFRPVLEHIDVRRFSASTSSENPNSERDVLETEIDAADGSLGR